jgi:hypothetical protein
MDKHVRRPEIVAEGDEGFSILNAVFGDKLRNPVPGDETRPGYFWVICNVALRPEVV